VDIVVIVNGQPDLLQIVFTGRAAGRFAGLLNGGQQQSDEDRDDRNHDEQFD
jgi:hypothetical protein